jgi:single-stranded-DNA-specific exonuclease
MTAYDLGFRLGPRINAAGRMDAARAVVELFDTRDFEEARRLANHLDARNEERKTVQQQIIDLAVAQLKETQDSYVAVIAGEGWHRGVIGIAASKIAERLNRPCVVLSIDGSVAHGSGRSIEAYHLLNGLTACSDLFEKFGGHSHAAGITIRPERINEFRRRLNEHAASCLTREDLEPSVNIDFELSPEHVTFTVARELEALEPFGAGNPRPVFMTKHLRCLSAPVIVKDRHLKLRVVGPQNRPLEAIWWNCIESPGQVPELKGSIELAYTLETSAWNGDYRMQLNVIDLRVS